ncbi:MAG: response regulator transcription factor [Proteobacteria bacterium]|nr:response regulator transcription factor [Pseudomonadota bacterium]
MARWTVTGAAMESSSSSPAGSDPASGGRDPEGRVRILLVDDHEVVRIGLRQLIDSDPELFVCGEAGSVAEARSAIEKLHPDVVLLDLTLGEESGFELLRTLDTLSYTPRVLVLSMYDESLYADDALLLGARGYTMKDAPPDDLLKAIHTVAGGAIYLSDRLTQRVMRRIATGREHKPSPQELLTPRELEVLERLAVGRTTREIAAELGTAVKTVDSHKRNLCEKLGLESAAELLRYAIINAKPRPKD